ncbi:hypothetical protein J5N97_008720 [Dioscorea zingiberensis]|uniref:Uncharacterized protein n=1 Tax=Dioscorea zingiberensis TaxID=325984 RepID=A0A9D5CV61_9LILI|nr:hypothetical protein J5N97_008720 [Dioscorea zingiberensis]
METRLLESFLIGILIYFSSNHRLQSKLLFESCSLCSPLRSSEALLTRAFTCISRRSHGGSLLLSLSEFEGSVSRK